ncbi:SIR2 family protein [Aeromicrobium alkaliterrae]|uniref:SIR2-like domain-containing protein n=1 Tax=Aeromicrobium alkaliterrae TaxID=302168 RepID=A0ABP4WFL4_9ACTN
MTPRDQLAQDLRSGRVVVLVGAGVSLAATGDANASWPGLLANGVDFAEARYAMDADTAEICRTMLSDASAENLLDVSTAVVDSMGGQEGALFEEWLGRSVGYLQVSDDRVIRSVLGLNCPIVTTNYDSLLENVGSRDHVTWTMPTQVQRVLAGQSRSIVHFHGHHSEPKSIVLSRPSYQLLLANKYIEALRHGMAATNTLIYIGFGAGMDDANFSSLRDWVAETLAGTPVKQYRLCRDDEVSQLVSEHAGEAIIPVPYGPGHDDLAPFLEQFEATAGTDAPFTPSQLLTSLENTVESASVIAPQTPNAAQRLTDFLVPPAVLPVNQEQWVQAAKSHDPLDRPKRCNNFEQLEHPFLMLSADENSGLTSALQWFVAQHHLRDASLIPLVVDGRSLAQRRKALDNALREELRIGGYSISDRAPLPAIALAIDNLDALPAKLLARTLNYLSNWSQGPLIVGCRTSSDIDLVPAMRERGLDPAQRFIGRMSKKDVRLLAGLTEAPDAHDLADRAIRVAQSQHLPTTPFTFSMIMVAVLRGGNLLNATSQTALLDAYLDILMGRGNPDEDSRFGLDSENRSYVVETLAELYVRSRRGSVAQAQVVDALETEFNQLEWEQSPIDTIKDFESRRLIAIRGTEIAFAQSSYLHLFAAKRAVRSPDFLDYLRADPLFFAPILQHYAALKRDDETLLVHLADLLDGLQVEAEFETGVFATSHSGKHAESDAALESVKAQMSAVAAADSDDDDLFELDTVSDRDVEPFPLTPLEDFSPVTRVAVTLSLVSSVLRDTEIMKTVAIRRRVLTELLTAWSNFVHLVETDLEYKDFILEVAEGLADELGLEGQKRSSLVKRFPGLFALGIGVGGLASNLSSVKLGPSLSKLSETSEFLRHPGRATLASVLAFDIQSDGWSELLLAVGERHREIDAVSNFLPTLAQQALIRQELTTEDSDNLLDFVTSTNMSRGAPRAQSVHFRNGLKKQVMTHRLASPQPVLPPGTSVLQNDQLDQA